MIIGTSSGTKDTLLPVGTEEVLASLLHSTAKPEWLPITTKEVSGAKEDRASVCRGGGVTGVAVEDEDIARVVALEGGGHVT